MNDHDLINALGGTSAVARICNVRPQAVSQWKKKGIPKSTRPLLVHYQKNTVKDEKTIAD